MPTLTRQTSYQFFLEDFDLHYGHHAQHDHECLHVLKVLLKPLLGFISKDSCISFKESSRVANHTYLGKIRVFQLIPTSTESEDRVDFTSSSLTGSYLMNTAQEHDPGLANVLRLVFQWFHVWTLRWLLMTAMLHYITMTD